MNEVTISESRLTGIWAALARTLQTNALNVGGKAKSTESSVQVALRHSKPNNRVELLNLADVAELTVHDGQDAIVIRKVYRSEGCYDSLGRRIPCP